MAGATFCFLPAVTSEVKQDVFFKNASKDLPCRFLKDLMMKFNGHLYRNLLSRFYLEVYPPIFCSLQNFLHPTEKILLVKNFEFAADTMSDAHDGDGIAHNDQALPHRSHPDDRRR